MTRIVSFIGVIVLTAEVASAQIVVAPPTLAFAAPDADFGITASYRVEFFSCVSVSTAGACIGRGTTPTSPVVVPKATVTGGPTDRRISFTTAPAAAAVAALPAGVPFVATLVAIGDPTAGGAGESGRSTDTDPFVRAGRVPGAPTNPRFP